MYILLLARGPLKCFGLFYYYCCMNRASPWNKICRCSNNENYYISNIKVNSSDEIKILDDQKSNYEKIKISNIQQLRKVSQNVFESLN